MRIRPRPHLVPGIAGAATLSIASAATLWASAPLYGPLVAEFGWHVGELAAAGAASLGITIVFSRGAASLTTLAGVRAAVLGGCLASGALLLVVLPNLTHVWQLFALLACLGISRALIVGGVWHLLRMSLSPLYAFGGMLICCIAGAALVAPWIAQIVYRNSWREGAAACGGLMLVIASPIAYLLLPGVEVEGCE